MMFYASLLWVKTHFSSTLGSRKHPSCIFSLWMGRCLFSASSSKSNSSARSTASKISPEPLRKRLPEASAAPAMTSFKVICCLTGRTIMEWKSCACNNTIKQTLSSKFKVSRFLSTNPFIFHISDHWIQLILHQSSEKSCWFAALICSTMRSSRLGQSIGPLWAKRGRNDWNTKE